MLDSLAQIPQDPVNYFAFQHNMDSQERALAGIADNVVTCII